jgi:hypothetical protein
MSLEQLSLEQILQTHEDIEAEERKKKKWKNSFCCSMSFRRKTVDRQTFGQPNNTWYYLFKWLVQLLFLTV